MLFNSLEFILAFLPLTLVGFFVIRKFSQDASLLWIVAASLFFYGWWNPIYLILLIGSILFNFSIGKSLSIKKSRPLLIFAVAINIGLLAYFKYANFFVDSFNTALAQSIELLPIILPLAISFFTFQQIAYLVDAYKKKTKEHSLLHYSLFVSFFPQLIAGPIVHHKEMLPQFLKRLSFKWQNLAIGSTIFILGLFKKVVIADSLARYASPVFDAALLGANMTIFEAWLGVLAYTFQLYFDFSGYADMAIGLAWLFGIKLPLNFYSPYKALSIRDFWRRWHMTLSRFLRDYLYIPLGGSKRGPVRTTINLAITMLLGGLWHGAGWTFVVWGGLHGLYLGMNHLWKRINPWNKISAWWTQALAWGSTFFFVTIAWVVFRAESFSAATHIWKAMFGSNGISLPDGIERKIPLLEQLGFSFNGMFHNAILDGPVMGGYIIVLSLLVALFVPNVHEFMGKHSPAIVSGFKSGNKVTWRPSYLWAGISIILFVISISLLVVGNDSEFLYFQF